MKKNLAIIACAGVAGLLVSCSRPKVTDSSSLTIVPGLGVTNVVAVGMTLSEIADRTADFQISTTREPRWFKARIPSLGVSLGGPYRGKRRPYYGFINFHIVPWPEEFDPRFTGSLLGGLSFAEAGSVTRDDLVGIFGTTEKTVLPVNSTNIFRFMQDGTSFSLLAAEQGEVLYYPAQGIMFKVHNGLVTRVAVYPKEIGRTKGSTLLPEGAAPSGKK
jgi:hypothetical protein